MRFLRDVLRKIRYNLKFVNKNKKTKLNYNINSSTNSKLTELMNYYGSDKGNKNNHHNYSEYYSELFFNKRKEVKNFLEIGLGTNDINIASNMGENGSPLASLKAWRDFFENANIYGADIDKKILKNHERIKTYFVDQTDPKTIELLFKNIGISDFDVILDDGLHDYNANIHVLVKARNLTAIGIFHNNKNTLQPIEMICNYIVKSIVVIVIDFSPKLHEQIVHIISVDDQKWFKTSHILFLEARNPIGKILQDFCDQY